MQSMSDSEYEAEADQLGKAFEVVKGEFQRELVNQRAQSVYRNRFEASQIMFFHDLWDYFDQ